VEVGLDNVRCHAHTREAEVTVATDETNVLLIVRDHGTGLLDGTAEPPGFHQIKRLRYRIEEVEGTLNVREHEAGGVVVTARVPRDQ
ncbi:MAG: ATP-binding protein, partial [Chloroflexota bacterium]|nr:ATP-binding protein [Chloroflexota bacterium]